MLLSEGRLISIKWFKLNFPITAVGFQSRKYRFITDRIYALFPSKNLVRVTKFYLV